MWQVHCDEMDPLATGMLACLAEVWCKKAALAGYQRG
jgi:hypothetical protein